MNDERNTTLTDVAYFCPDCGRPALDSGASRLCDQCGGTVVVQGFCPVCEARVRQRVGELCPKHDIELLEDEPDASPIPAAGAAISWVTVKRFPDSLAASAARIRLDAEGIPTFLEGERMGAPAMYRVATGGVKLQVPAELAADARVILDQDWSWPGDEPELDEGPAMEGEWPEPDDPSPRALLIELTLILTLAIPLVAALVVYLVGD